MGAGREPNHSSPWQTTAVTTYPQKQRCKTIMRGVCLAPALLAFLVHAKEEEDVKGRFLNPLNEDQAAAVTAGAVGLGLGSRQHCRGQAGRRPRQLRTFAARCCRTPARLFRGAPGPAVPGGASSAQRCHSCYKSKLPEST